MKTKFKSYSKVNIDLKVMSYLKKIQKHKLRSNIVILKLSDDIDIQKSIKNNIVYLDGRSKKKLIIQNDIIDKTIKFFDKKYSTKTSLSIKINKFIPVGYGLGGGSSNASVVLKYLYALHSISYSNFDFDSHVIGSDVCLFKDMMPKKIDGIKSFEVVIKPSYKWNKIYLLLPSKKNPTNKIFSLLKNAPKNTFLSSENMSSNDLLLPAMHYNNEMKEIILFLEKNCKLFVKYGMTGSGSGVFIIFRTNSSQRSFFNELKSLFPLASIEKSEYFS